MGVILMLLALLLMQGCSKQSGGNHVETPSESDSAVHTPFFPTDSDTQGESDGHSQTSGTDHETETTPAFEQKLAVDDIDETFDVTIEDSTVKGLTRNGYFGFHDVDLSDIQSIRVCVDSHISGGRNGETLAIMLDHPTQGDCIGYLVINQNGDNLSVTTPITPTTGVHTVYVRGVYGNSMSHELTVKDIFLSDRAVEKTQDTVPDSAIRDIYSDTWTAVDDYGRKIADYSEVGRIDDGSRQVAMLYWNWFSAFGTDRRATVISTIITRYPEAKHDYINPAWDQKGIFYWSEPVLGYYLSDDYWVYRKHAEMLANAGVDAIFLDFSNSGNTYIRQLNILAQAFKDAKASGIDIPRISLFAFPGNAADSYRGLATVYINCFVENDYSDIWFYVDGKPLIFGWDPDEAKNAVSGDRFALRLVTEMKAFFSFRAMGSRNSAEDGKEGDKKWMWLENFPQVQRNPDENGRPEMMTLGVSINKSTVYGGIGVFSDEFTKGRGYSEAFGEDYTADGMREAYFFREQARLVLDADPKLVVIDGWNEWIAERQPLYNGFTNAFVDTYDDENSRDIEPSRGALKDDYYNLLVDFVRKYKGSRPAPVAEGNKTIDINGSPDQWDSVQPQFLNADQSYERDITGFSKSLDLVENDQNRFDRWHYQSNVCNVITSAKVSFDQTNLYFMVQTAEDIDQTADNLLHLFINTDRNAATGQDGYDFAINVGGLGMVTRYGDTSATVGTAEYSISGRTLQLSVPRSLVGETGTVDLEFKWTDSVPAGDILDYYAYGSSAPLGRFNYLYTEIPQDSLTAEERSRLDGASVLKAGSSTMVVEGALMPVHEADNRIVPYEEGNMLYVPIDACMEILGYGRAKELYYASFNMLRTYGFDMNASLTQITNYTWTYGELDSKTVHVNGVEKQLSAAPTQKNGIIYLPLSFIAECYGRTLTKLGNGIYCIGTTTVPQADIRRAALLIQ